MSHFRNMHGGVQCKNCMYYRKSKRCPAMRCDHENNLRDGHYGTVYMQVPDAKNYNHKCKDYKEK